MESTGIGPYAPIDNVTGMIRGFRIRSTGFLVLTGLLVFAPATHAQDQNESLISAEAASKTLNRYEISIAAAEKIAAACVAYAEEKGKLVSIYILAPDGSVVLAYRMDGQNKVTTQSALRKAKTVIDMKMSTRAVSGFPANMHAGLYDLGQFPFTGGLPVLIVDQLIGSVGVGGMSGEEDEECAYEAITAVIGPQPPLPEE
jgi:glc operon protein GlcG